MAIGNKLRQYYLLIKFSLSTLVVFSSVISYLLVENIILDWAMVGWLALGGFLVTASANTLNQIAEKDTDALMSRTALRPLASAKMGKTEAQIFAFVCGAVGFFILSRKFNIQAASVSILSLFIYVAIYTPMKKVSSLAVFVGALPGAFPCLIGWMAGSPHSIMGGLVLFAIQFVWQFPHFWAIAWISHEDYSKAGFKLLPSTKGPGKYAAMQTIIFSLLLLPLGFAPYLVKMCKAESVIFISIPNLVMIYLCIKLYTKMNKTAAKAVMFASYFYLATIFFVMYFFKIN